MTFIFKCNIRFHISHAALYAPLKMYRLSLGIRRPLLIMTSIQYSANIA